MTPLGDRRDGTLVRQPAGVLAAMVRAGDVSPLEVVRAHLDRITSLDHRIGAFQIVREMKALDEAAALAARADLAQLPLAGVPIAIKDTLPVAGEPMRVGSRATSDAPSASDHETVRRLRAAGAIVIGITSVPELCAWATTDSAFGVTRNPWNLERTTGGSSGGSAAAVAAGMVPLALGADGLGSIRIPAAACGVVGIKPGPGVVPAELGVSSWYGLAENGPMATTVEDAAVMLSVLAGRPELAVVGPPNRPLRIAVTTRSPLAGVSVDRELCKAALDAAQCLAAAGHVVEEADPPVLPLRTVVAILAHWFGGTAQEAGTVDDARLLEPRTRMHARLGRLSRSLGLIRPRVREAWRQRNEPFFSRYDLLLSPVLASMPIPCDRWSERGWLSNVYANTRFAPFAGGWNFAGYPAAAVPAGIHSGLPLSVQLVAARGREGVILAGARQLEMLRPWPHHAPLAHFTARRALEDLAAPVPKGV